METEKVELIKIEKPGINRANIGRSVGMLIGLIIFIIGLIFCITIFLLIPGIFGVLIGLVVMAKNVPKAIVKCPACDFENKAAPPQASVECERCKTNLPIKWTETPRGFWTRSIFAKRN